jgi:hypothetical protein
MKEPELFKNSQKRSIDKSIWYIANLLKDVIAINYQDDQFNFKDKEMRHYYYLLKQMCVDLIGREERLKKEDEDEFDKLLKEF